MNILKKVLTLVVLLVTVNTYSQIKEFKKITVADLEQKVYPNDTSAVAAYLYQVGKVHYEYNMGFTTVTTVKTRIKIFKKAGYGYANQIINYYVGFGSAPSISISDAYTYNLSGGTIEKVKLQSDGKFSNKVTKNWAQKKFAMPNVKVGSIIEYEYVIRQPGISTPSKWNFQYQIPVAYSEFNVTTPDYFIFKKNQRGFLFPKVITEPAQINNNTIPATKSVYILENVPAITPEPFVGALQNYTSSISHELSSVEIPAIFSGGYYEKVSNNWETIAKKLYLNPDFQDELAKTKYFEADVDALIKGVDSNKDRVKAIFNFVKSKVKWNGDEGFVCDDGVKLAYQNGTGNAAEINLMLIAMLRYANITTNPVLLSTRDNGIVLFPSLALLNHVVAVVEADNQLLLLDATDPNATPGILPVKDLNYQGILIRKEANTAISVDLTPKTISKETHNLSYAIDSEGVAKGKLRKSYTDHRALEKRTELSKANEDEYLQNYEQDHHSVEITEYNHEHLKELEDALVETFSFSSKNDVEIINNKMYFDPILFLTQKKNPFQQEKRVCPIDFAFPLERKYNVSIEIPQGYKVETLPTAITYVTGDEVGTFKYLITANENKIQTQIIFSIAAPVLPEDYYEIIKDFYQKVIDKQTEKIVLTKI